MLINTTWLSNLRDQSYSKSQTGKSI